MEGWNPPIDREILGRLAFLPDTPDLQDLEVARESVDVFLPKILRVLQDRQGDRYYMNASESHGRIFYFFSPRHPIDAFSLTLSARGGRATVVFGYTPYGLDGRPNFKGMRQQSVTSDPEMAGLAVMRLIRSVVSSL